MLDTNRISAVGGLTHPKSFLTCSDQDVVFILHKRPKKAKDPETRVQHSEAGAGGTGFSIGSGGDGGWVLCLQKAACHRSSCRSQPSCLQCGYSTRNHKLAVFIDCRPGLRNNLKRRLSPRPTSLTPPGCARCYSSRQF